MYRGGPSQMELELLGISSLEELGGEPPTEVWQENWAAIRLFLSLRTQWRYSMAGPTGLDYGAVGPAMKLMSVAKSDRADTFERLMILEDEALKIIYEQIEK